MLNNKQNGVSLIELMIASLLAVWLVNSAFNLLIANSKMTYLYQDRDKLSLKADQAITLLNKAVNDAGADVLGTLQDTGFAFSGYMEYSKTRARFSSDVDIDSTASDLHSCWKSCQKNVNCFGFEFDYDTLQCRLVNRNKVNNSFYDLIISATSNTTRHFVLNALLSFVKCGTISNCSGKTDHGAALAVAHQIGNQADFCTQSNARSSNANLKVIHRYYVDSVNGQKGLMCSSYEINGTLRGTPVMLVPGIAYLDVNYLYKLTTADPKIDNPVSTVRDVDTLRSSIDGTPASNESNIKGVQFGLLVEGELLDNHANKQVSQQYKLMGNNITLNSQYRLYSFYSVVHLAKIYGSEYHWKGYYIQ